MRAVDPLLAVSRVRAVGDIVAQSMGSRRFNATLLGAFAGVALLLAAIGVYGVLSYSVAQRGHEIAVRRALGAGARDVAALVARQAAGVAGQGLALGLLGALALAHVLRALLFAVHPLDPVTLVATVAVVVAGHHRRQPGAALPRWPWTPPARCAATEWRPSSACAASRRAFPRRAAASGSCAASTWTWRKATSSPSWGRRGRARPRC